MQRSTKAEVVSSTFDEPPENHVKVTDMVSEPRQAAGGTQKRCGHTDGHGDRLARAHNLVVPPSGRTLSGGIDPASLDKPKRFFGAALVILEEGGSLTICATALVETGSKDGWGHFRRI